MTKKKHRNKQEAIKEAEAEFDFDVDLEAADSKAGADADVEANETDDVDLPADEATDGDSTDDDSAEAKIAELIAGQEAAEDKYLRLAAEYDNYRKRTKREKEALYADSIQDVISAWLPVLDNLDRALELEDKLTTEEGKSMAEGVRMVREQAIQVMATFGVEEIDALNNEFDPNLHHAVLHEENDDQPDNTVVEVLQKGYRRGDRVIRPSMVKVAN